MPYLSALEVCLRRGAIEIHVYLYFEIMRSPVHHCSLFISQSTEYTLQTLLCCPQLPLRTTDLNSPRSQRSRVLPVPIMEAHRYLEYYKVTRHRYSHSANVFSNTPILDKGVEFFAAPGCGDPEAIAKLA